MTAQLTSWIADLGLAGVFALMAVDALLPAGGELIMLFAGALQYPLGPYAALTAVASLLWCAA